jgi:8-oxo-dGTP diphosphatase
MMARAPVLAAGGIVLRQAATPLVAVVRLRKRDEWVLPKGKLDHGETARAAAEREVIEETGRAVAVHEFLGTLVYDSGGRSKVVHFWRMEAVGEPARKLMSDVKAVDWLPLDRAVRRLSRDHERAFLENVGPLALQAAQAVAGAGSAAAPAPEPAIIDAVMESRRASRSFVQKVRLCHQAASTLINLHYLPFTLPLL